MDRVCHGTEKFTANRCAGYIGCCCSRAAILTSTPVGPYLSSCGVWLRCLCHSDVDERMNNARPHYEYCHDDVNPTRPARLALLPARPPGWQCAADVASNTATSPRRPSALLADRTRLCARLPLIAARQVCLNNSSTRRRDTRTDGREAVRIMR